MSSVRLDVQSVVQQVHRRCGEAVDDEDCDQGTYEVAFEQAGRGRRCGEHKHVLDPLLRARRPCKACERSAFRPSHCSDVRRSSACHGSPHVDGATVIALSRIVAGYSGAVTHAVEAQSDQERRKEAIGFVVVGGFNLVVEIVVFNLLRESAGPVGAKITATVVGSISAFLMNRHWTFSHRPRTGLRREFGIFSVAAVIAIAINAVVVALARYGLGIDDGLGLNVANLVGIGLATVFRFVAYKYWVFARSAGPAAALSE
jgi:putative flippase GtrA